ncbi:MAG: tetratricopeptide repeat protein, partial [Elusimicrobia bacterium]|nr:tetratricopeptide repeat protein [Elusimicrobiota bacterium]
AAALAAGALALAVLPPAARAASSSPAAGYEAIDGPYFERNLPGKLAESLAAARAALQERPGDAALLWREGRDLVRRGEKASGKAGKLADYRAAEAALARAVELDPKSADAHFWYGVAMGRRGETQGILHSLFLIKPIRAQMRATLALDPDHGGAHRVLGEILWQVPGFAGGDKKAALAEFEAAVRLDPSYTANYEPLAQAYLHFHRGRAAVRVLKALEAVKEPKDPASYPDDLADARKTLAELAR